MLLTTVEVAQILRVHPNTLYAWKAQGRGPKVTQLGRSLRFRKEDVEAWITEQGGADGGDRDVASDEREQ